MAYLGVIGATQPLNQIAWAREVIAVDLIGEILAQYFFAGYVYVG